MARMRRSIKLKKERGAFGLGLGFILFSYLCVCVCVIKMKTTNNKIFVCKMSPFSEMQWLHFYGKNVIPHICGS